MGRNIKMLGINKKQYLCGLETGHQIKIKIIMFWPLSWLFKSRWMFHCKFCGFTYTKNENNLTAKEQAEVDSFNKGFCLKDN
jgi:hypothetical protein